MSSHSTKTAGRSAKAARRPEKKGAKSARAVTKKASKSARRPVGKVTRPAASAIRAPSIAPKSATQVHTEVQDDAHAEPADAAAWPPPKSRSTTHKYQVGETVYYTSPTFGRAAATGSYTVVKLLPSEGDDYQYRIKSSGEAFERVAKESQLDRV